MPLHAETPSLADSPRDEDGFRNRGKEVTRSEAFFDAAFAFAVTLMVISIDEIPKTASELASALKSVPAFGASFLIIASFWRKHADWSRHYGIDDRFSQRLSLLLVFFVLIFIYPLRMVFGAFFELVSGGWLPANLRLESIADARLMFGVFAVAYGTMATPILLLQWHAWRQRQKLQLDEIEIYCSRQLLLNALVAPPFAILSLVVALQMPAALYHGWRAGLPGYVLFGLMFAQAAIHIRMRRGMTRRLAKTTIS